MPSRPTVTNFKKIKTASDVEPLPQGFEARQAASIALQWVLFKKQPLDAILDAADNPLNMLEGRDRALARAILGVSLRRLGSLRTAMALNLRKPVTEKAEGRLECILLTALAQILCLDVPDHAAVQLGVEQVKRSRQLKPLAPLVNAVLRATIRGKTDALAVMNNPVRDVPDWLHQRRIKAYGNEQAESIACAERVDSPLDITVKENPQEWAEKLDGFVLPQGSVRLRGHGAIVQMEGFTEGNWWVQDAAASIPARLFGDIRGKRIADLCAAPGGKTAQLIVQGADVTAVDRSASRISRLKSNLSRLRLSATTVVADAANWEAEAFDAVLLDAPCSATGTVRRNPDVAWLKSAHDITSLTRLQSRLLDATVNLLKTGGILVYATCSLEPEEGEEQIRSFLERYPEMVRSPVNSDEVWGQTEWVNAAGEIRTLPSFLPHADPDLAGMDGFFAARLIKTG